MHPDLEATRDALAIPALPPPPHICHSKGVEKDRILAILREHEPELKAAGLLHLRLFGSIARGDNTPTSDVDLLFDYDESDTWNLLGAYGFQEDVTKILGVKAHLSSMTYMRPEIREHALREAVLVY